MADAEKELKKAAVQLVVAEAAHAQIQARYPNAQTAPVEQLQLFNAAKHALRKAVRKLKKAARAYVEELED